MTEDTVKEIKKLRADLNKRFKELEDERKAVKAKVMAPYEAFEEVYKKYVTDIFKYTEARAGRIPHFRAGNRYIFDVEQVDEFLKRKALDIVKEEQDEKVVQYGQLRKINV